MPSSDSKPTLEGRYVDLRPIRVEDAELTFGWRQGARAVLLNQGAQTVEQQARWIAANLLRPDGAAIQQGFIEHHGLQCGYCTPGMVMAATSLLAENPSPTEREVREGLEGNLCRCTGYHNIVKAIAAAQDVMHGKRESVAAAAE